MVSATIYFQHETTSFYWCWRNCRTPMSPIILIQLLGIARLAHRRQKTVPLGSRQNKNTSFAYPRYGVASGGAFRRIFLFRHSLQLN